MNILTIIFTTNHADTLGNSCRLEMIRYLTNAFDTTILTNQPEFIKILFTTCQVFEIDAPEKSKLPLLNNINYWKSIATKVNHISSDVVFMFDNDSPAALWIKYPVFQYVHQYGARSSHKSNWIKESIKNFIAKFNDDLKIQGLRKSSWNFVVSKPIIDILKKRGVTNVEVIPHALELTSYQKPFLSSDHDLLKKLKENGCFLVTYTGWVTENRGIKLMLDSINSAVKQDKKIVLVIAGANEDFSKRIELYKSQNGLESNIVNFGVVDVSLIPGILYYSDVCLSFLDDLPAFHISPPQKVIEYFAAGKPVICNKIEPHEWLVSHNKNGFILNYNADEVSQAIVLLKMDKKLVRLMGDDALETASEYDISLVYGNMVKKIRKILGEH